MIAKARGRGSKGPRKGAAGPRAREPLDVRLTLRFKFGHGPGDAITVMDQRRVPMVESVFANRDRILRGFVGLLLRTGLASPAVARELLPALRLLRRGPRP